MLQTEPWPLKGTVETSLSGHRWRMCITQEKDWCVEFDEDAIAPNGEPTLIENPPDPFGRSLVLLKPDAHLVEFRMVTVADFLSKGSMTRPGSEGPNGEPTGEIGDPTTRSAFC